MTRLCTHAVTLFFVSFSSYIHTQTDWILWRARGLLWWTVISWISLQPPITTATNRQQRSRSRPSSSRSEEQGMEEQQRLVFHWIKFVAENKSPSYQLSRITKVISLNPRITIIDSIKVSLWVEQNWIFCPSGLLYYKLDLGTCSTQWIRRNQLSAM